MWWPGACLVESRWCIREVIAHDAVMPFAGTTIFRCSDGCCCSAGLSTILRGHRCYPLVEAASAWLWLSALVVQSGGGLPQALLPWAGLPLVALLLPLVLIDLDHLWLPEPLCRWGVLLGLVLSAAGGLPLLAGHLIAAGLALLVLEQLSALAERILGQPALGLGDAKLAALGGAWLGLTGITAAMALAVISGAVIGSIGRVSGRLQPRQPFPFGPFIAMGIWLVWLTGPLWWWEQWQSLLGL